jgi:DNA-binding response OmpR family regulator
MLQAITKLRVLVADPSSHMAALVAQMLHSLKIRSVDALVELDPIISELNRHAFDLILIDEQLAGGNDFGLIRSLRQSANHPNRLTPIIMLAAAPDAKMIATARDAGVTEFLRKPFSAEHIQLRIDGLQKAPRPFVEATDYAGPDRRRKRVVSQAQRRASDKASGTA